MTAAELRAILMSLDDMTQADAAKLVGVELRTMQRWCAGPGLVPGPAAKLFHLLSLGLLTARQVAAVGSRHRLGDGKPARRFSPGLSLSRDGSAVADGDQLDIEDLLSCEGVRGRQEPPPRKGAEGRP